MYTKFTHFSSQKTAFKIFQGDNALREFLLPWGCYMTPLHQPLFGFQFKTVNPNFMPLGQLGTENPHLLYCTKISSDFFSCLFVCICRHLWYPSSTDLGSFSTHQLETPKAGQLLCPSICDIPSPQFSQRLCISCSGAKYHRSVLETKLETTFIFHKNRRTCHGHTTCEKDTKNSTKLIQHPSNIQPLY